MRNFTITPVLDTNIYADGDVLWTDSVEIPNAVRANGLAAQLASIQVLDKDDQGAAFDLYILNAATSLGTANAAASYTDTAGETIVGGPFPIASGDYRDLGGSRVANPAVIPAILKAAAGSKSLWVAGISRGTGTYTASGLKITIGLKDAGD